MNPVFGSNKLKLGIFCTNGKGASQTLVPEAGRVSWPMSLETAQMVDRAGYEAVVPYARWKGYVDDQPDHITGSVLDPFTWAAAIAQATRRVGVFVTSHAPTIHPIMAAKQTATIDIISGGRLALNVVGGWNKPELEMFGAPLKEHDQRYDHLQEWLSVVERLWSGTEEFDHEGAFFSVKRGFSMPKPIQQPRPPIMNAGGSDRGRLFACEHADLCFVIVKSEKPEAIRAEVESYKQTARERFGREVQVWTHTYVVQRDINEEADAYFRYFAIDNQDRRSVDGWIEKQKEQTQIMPPAVLESFRNRFAAGAGGFPLVGDAERILSRLQMLSEAGMDGVLLTWVDYVDGINRFNRDVMPKLEALGLREPYRPEATAEAA